MQIEQTHFPQGASYSFQYGDQVVQLETGMIARQATAAVLASIQGTTVLVSVVANKNENLDHAFFPLSVHYQERAYAAGRIPGGFLKREGRPNEREVLIARLIDRAIRPRFPHHFRHEVQVIISLLSLDPQISPDVVAMIGVSAALARSGLPFHGPIGVARVGYVQGQYLLNPTADQLHESDLDLIVAGSEEAIIMVESEAFELSEALMLEALAYGYQQQQQLIENLKIFVQGCSVVTWRSWTPKQYDEQLTQRMAVVAKEALVAAYQIVEKEARRDHLLRLKVQVTEQLMAEHPQWCEQEIAQAFAHLEKQIVREALLKSGRRIDGRECDMVRALDIRTHLLQRAHGSALFTRGETQALVAVTLGAEREAKSNDDLMDKGNKRFWLDYNFLPFSVGETGPLGSPKRREIGHGHLAARALQAVLPAADDFPYTIRIVSDITESNGSSSMASVCGASLAMMDAGVPIKSAVAGVAMGLIKEGEAFVVLSDILEDEDHFGDMDFKVAGTAQGVTALQMDVKISGVDKEILRYALQQAKMARLHILNVMKEAFEVPATTLSEFAPRIYTLQIAPDKIRDVIGKGGAVIRSLSETTGATIDIEDTGLVKIFAADAASAQSVVSRINEIVAELQVGEVYQGKVVRIVDFGAFIALPSGKEGLVHISQLADHHIERVTDYLKPEQTVFVKVINVDQQGRIRFTPKDVNQKV